MSISAMKQALKALESWQKTCLDCGRGSEELGRATKPIAALRQAIAEAEKQEPVAWVYPEALEAFRQGKPWTAYGRDGNGPHTDGVERTPLYAAPVHAIDISQECVDETAKDKHEPVAWFIQYEYRHEFLWREPTAYEKNSALKIKPLYTAPSKREWVGLTDEERNRASGWSVKHVEEYLKEKNT